MVLSVKKTLPGRQWRAGDGDPQFEDGSVDLELDDSEQELEFEDDQVVDEVIEEPEGAKSIRLRVNNCNVDLDIIKGVKPHDKKAAAQPEQKKGEAATAPTETKEESVSFAAEAKEWLNDNRQNGALIGSIVGAVVGIVGVAGVAIAKSRKRASEKSVLVEDGAADAEAEAEVDDDAASESERDVDSDEDVEAGVTALTVEDAAEEEKKSSVVEGSVCRSPSACRSAGRSRRRSAFSKSPSNLYLPP
ncbi:hypothetical protein PF005_g21880 [Phytophthora fragariae]|uniref:Uncharacterized protein n=1 Tax=Phytophthora fragariae TaxID=53985 RepID=A0A6A3WPZ3_9STRA|nr:hypothetical protein PF005_g21880 [Phytophthora fragariae]